MSYKNRRSLIRRLPLFVLVALLLVFVTTPGSAQLLLVPNALHGDDSEHPRGLKLCLVVRDARNESVVKTEMCGLIRNGYGKVMHINVLGNQEPLDQILAYSLADSLEFAGYEVVQVYPDRLAQLESKPRKLKTLKHLKADFKLAKKSQTKEERKIAKAEHKREADREGVSFSRISGEVAALGSEGWTNGADAVLVVSIDTFTSDQSAGKLTLGDNVAWSAATLTIAPGESGHQGKMATTQVRRWGERNDGFGTPKKKITRALNLSYQTLVDEAEAVFLSDEFFAAIKSLNGSAEETD